MTQLEQKQEELIELLKFQAIDLSLMSKIEFGDDVIEKWNTLNKEIIELKDINFLTTHLYNSLKKPEEDYVPFVSEVEEFNAVMGKPIIIPRTYPRKKSGCSFIILFWKNSRNINMRVKQGTLLKFLMLCVTLPMSRLVMGLCYMALRIKYGPRIKKYKPRILAKLAQVKKKRRLQLRYDPKNKANHVTMKRLGHIISSIEHVTAK
jgi:hypothetical protein